MINFWAVLVAAIAAMIIGSIWWGPLFGKMWMKENGFDQMSEHQKEAMKKGMFGMYFQQLVVSFIQAWVLAWAINTTGYDTAGMAAKLAIILWIGFIFPIQYGNKIWGNKKFKFVLATLASSIITMIVMAWILAAWK